MLLRSDEIHIQAERISIAPFSPADADAAFACITPSLTRWMACEPPRDRESFEQTWSSWLASVVDGTDFVFTIREARSREFLGLVGLHKLRHGNPDLGIWIRESRQPEGSGHEAVGHLAIWASRELGVASFSYPVAEENRPSRRIAETLGGVVVERRATSKYMSVIYQMPCQQRQR